MSDRNESSYRWWEFYAIRYGMGTIVGAVIFYILSKTSTSLDSLVKIKAEGIDSVSFTLMAAFGLTYCYIASAPILVLHAVRFRLKQLEKIKMDSVLLRTAPPLILSIIAFFYSSSNYIISIIQALSVGVHAFFSLSQIIFIYNCIKHQGDMFSYYSKLSLKRKKEKTDIIDSYKHLREHGNSFFIVFLEVILGVILFVSGSFWHTKEALENFDSNSVLPYFIVIFLWIFPASGIWFVGTYFEMKYKEKA